MGKVYAEARRSQRANELLDALVASPPAVDPQKVQGAKDLSALATQRLQEALRLLEAKATPEDTEGYKDFVLSVGRAAAEAHKEGGFIGIGGQPISEEEQVALDELGEVLR